MMVLLLTMLVAGGAVMIVVGARQARRPAGDAMTYLSSLDDAPTSADEFAEILSTSFLSRVVAPVGTMLFSVVGRFTPQARRDQVKRDLMLAGLTIRAEEFLATQAIAAAAGVGLGLFYFLFAHGSPTMRIAAFGMLCAIGILGPSAWLKRKVEERKHAIFMDLPDVLDLLAISVEAGVAFEGAVAIVCQHFDSPLAREFSRALREMELGLARREALQNLRKRTEVPELSNFILALVQADSLGMPIGKVLHVQAGEMRNRRRMYAREKAGQLPVKILFPLMLFIFPSILIVILGPAAGGISKAL